MNEEMMALMQNMTPEQQAAIFENYSGAEGQIQGQLQQAEGLRDRQTGQGVSAGNQFVASSPLSGLANVVNQGTSAYKRSNAQDAQDELLKKKQLAMDALVKGLRNGGQQQPQLDPNSLQDAPVQPYNPNQQMA